MPRYYSDTEQGAVECLKVETTYDITQVKCVRKSNISNGVWVVDFFSGTRVIVYLAGHGDQKHSPFNDYIIER